MQNEEKNRPQSNTSVAQTLKTLITNPDPVKLEELILFFENILKEGAWCYSLPQDVVVMNDLEDIITTLNSMTIK